jgi:hypothetical protein
MLNKDYWMKHTYAPSSYMRGQESGSHENKSYQAHSPCVVLDKRHDE